jgi:Oxidoreductase molybdopterin binding domain
MQMRVWTAVLGLVIGVSSAAAGGQDKGQVQGQPMPGVPVTPIGGVGADRLHGMNAATTSAGPLKITFGKKSSQWTPATLAALPHKTITVYNEHAKVNQTYSGVELIDLLTPLGVDAKPHGKEFRLYLVAEGSDGYQVAYSIGEVTPDVHDGTVMVADTLDGKPIAETGPVQLVTTGEKRPARWVRNLVAIRVQTAE